MPPLRKAQNFTKIKDRSLSEQAYEAMRTSIVEGQIEPGGRVVEYRVAEELGISRAPVREALRRLVEEHLVVEQPRYGTFVRELSASDFVDIYNARIAVETAAARLVARGRFDLTAADDLIAEMFAAARRRQRAKVVNLELEVHLAICAATGNPFLDASFRSLSGVIRLALALDDQSYANLDDIAAEHPPLLDALRSGDEERAARSMHQHIVASIDPVLQRLGGSRDAILGVT